LIANFKLSKIPLLSKSDNISLYKTLGYQLIPVEYSIMYEQLNGLKRQGKNEKRFFSPSTLQKANAEIDADITV